MFCIYKVTNIINQKCYVGYTKNFKMRKTAHKNNALKTDKPFAFYAAIRKYGWQNFKWEIIYESWDGIHCLSIMEPHFIQEHQSFGENGYNMDRGGRKGMIGLKRKPFTSEQKEKIRQATIAKTPSGKDHPMYGTKANANFIAARDASIQRQIGKHLSEETRNKISKSNMGKKNTLGMIHSDTTKKQMSDAVPTWLRTLRAQTWRAIKNGSAMDIAHK